MPTQKKTIVRYYLSMLATSGRRPFNYEEWQWAVKWDWLLNACFHWTGDKMFQRCQEI